MRTRARHVMVAALVVGCASRTEPPATPGASAAQRAPSSGDGPGVAALAAARSSRDRGDHEGGVRHAVEAGTHLEAAGDVRAGEAWQIVGHMRLAQKRCSEAALAYKRGLVVRERILGPYAHEVAVSLGSLAEAHRCSDDHAGAIPHFDRVYRILSSDPGYLDERVDIAQRLAVSFRKLGKPQQAAAVLHDAAAAVATTRGRESPLYLSLLDPLEDVLRALGQVDAAAALWEGLSVQKYCAPMACSEVPVDSPPPTHTVRIGDAAQVVSSLRPLFKACYDAALGRDRAATGRIQLTLRVVSDGSVAYVKGRRSGALDNDATQCVLLAALGARFAKPEGGPFGSIVVPVTFVPQ